MYPIIIWLSARMIEGFKIFPPKWPLLLQKWPSFIPKRHQNRRFLQHRPIFLPKWPFFATKMTVFPPKWPSFLKMTVISSKMTVISTEMTLGQSGRSGKVVNGLLSRSGRSWVKEDGHLSKSARFFGWIEVSKWTVQKYFEPLVHPNTNCALILGAP